MNNDNFVATQPKTVVLCIMKCQTITKICRVRKLNTLRICFVLDFVFIDFFDFVFYLIRISNF